MVFLPDPKAEDGLPMIGAYINGLPQPLQPSDDSFPVINAVSDTIVHHAVSANSTSAIAACDAASLAFQTWRKTTPTHRRSLLLKAADAVESKIQEIMQAQVIETSCPQEFAAINVQGGVANMREIAAATSELRGTIPQRSTKPDGVEVEGLTVVVREPVGVVLVIPPWVCQCQDICIQLIALRWNGAVVLPLRAISQVLAAGCTVVLKASELCPKTHHLLVRCFEEAGIPKGTINVVQARREDAAEVTEAIVAHKAVRKIDFIGSAAVGSQIGQVCAKHLKPILMELGGKGPALVLEDADLQKAAFLCAIGGVYFKKLMQRILIESQLLRTMDSSASPRSVSSSISPSTTTSLRYLQQLFQSSRQQVMQSRNNLRNTHTMFW